MMCRKWIGVICSVLMVLNVQAQDIESDTKWHVGLKAAGGLSYTGYNLFLLPSVSYGHHTLYVGPKLAMTSSYFPVKNNWGVNVGYKVNVVSNAHWDAGLGLDYQCSFYKPYNPYGLGLTHKYNKINEVYVAVHLSYRPVKEGRLHFDIALGTGGFWERFEDVTEGATMMNAGRASLAAIGIGYKIF